MKIEKEETHKKTTSSTNRTLTIILMLITVTFFIVITIIVLMASMKDTSMSVIVDGQRVEVPEDTFLFTEVTGEIYVSIKDIAGFVGYEPHNGEYKVNSEDTNKMYVEAKDATETTSFYLNSNLISKIAPDSIGDYENIELKSPVTMIDDKWYINSEGFMQAFNLVFSYNNESKVITIQTLPYLTAYYKENIKNFGYDEFSEDFNNQKALIYGMLVASKSSTNKFGVVNIRNGKEIISPRYNDIQFIESSQEFIITNSSGKVGIAYSNGDTKINVLYDEIKMIDNSLGYYLVKSNSKYGIVNSDEKSVVHIEYDSIGIDTKTFKTDNIKNQYILYDTLIPVCLNQKWGLFDIEGKKVTDLEYTSIGCDNKNIKDRKVDNVIVVGDSEVVVVSKDGLYGLITTKGDLLGGVRFENVFSITSEGETTYWLILDGTDYNALDYIRLSKERLGYDVDNNQSGETSNEDNQNGESENKLNESNTNNEGQNVENNNDDNSNNNEPDGENENTENTNNEENSINSFNSKFEHYAGEHSRGSVRSLLDLVQESNLTNDNKIQIEYNGNTYIDNLSILKQELTNSIYNIVIEHNTETGYIQKIIIS